MRPAKAQASLRIRAVSPEPSLLAHLEYGSKRRVRPKIRHLALLDGCACTFEESHDMAHLLNAIPEYSVEAIKALIIFMLLSPIAEEMRTG